MEVRFSSALSQGSILALLLVFIAGVLSSFTPCVYPVIPITIGYIGGRAQGKRLRGLLLSIFLVLGIATIYSVLGLLAAATGSIFGSYTQHPLVLIIIALIFAAMGASLLGAFDITLPASLQSKMHTERKGFLGAYLVGIITGVIAVPCVGPVLVALLAWVAQSGSLLIGFLLLFVYALGMGMLFVFIGTFTGVLTSLPGAGQWMETIKHIFGVVLIAGAVFILKPLLSMGVYYLAWSILLIVTGIFSGASEIMSPEANTGKKWSRALGLILLLAGIVLFIKGFNLAFKLEESTGGRIALVEKKQAILWLVNEPEKAFAEARASGKKLIMDFYADWCAACVELDEKTWTDPELVRLSSNFVFLKLDLTKITPELKAEQIKYQIRGMPTVIFFDPNGKELTRFSGFKSAREVLDLINLL
jgi:thiol:disulfide interchange protein DsbD